MVSTPQPTPLGPAYAFVVMVDAMTEAVGQHPVLDARLVSLKDVPGPKRVNETGTNVNSRQV